MIKSILKSRGVRTIAWPALAIVAGVGIGAGIAPALHATTALTAPSVSAPAMPASFAAVVAAVKPAVVHIRVTQRVEGRSGDDGAAPTLPERFFGDDFRRRFSPPPGFAERPTPRRATGLGSGFLIEADGHVVTNNHVIGDADRIVVTLNEGRELSATVVGRDARTDLALLKVNENRPLPFVRFADHGPQVGDWVVAVGSPFGLGNTVTAGIVSAHGRSVGAEGPYEGFLQIDAPINPGSSGGPAFNLRGEVVGVNTAIFTPSGGNVGIGFAVPAKSAKSVIMALRQTGRVERGWLGVAIQELTPPLAEGLGLADHKGALVSNVTPGSPAARAGLRAGDIVRRVNTNEVASVKDLPRLIAELKDGSEARIEVVREGKSLVTTVTIGALPDRSAATGPAKNGEADRKLGLAIAPLTPEARLAHGIPREMDGVLVAAVRPDSVAAEEGLRPGDVVTAVGATPVTTPAELGSAVARAEQERKKTVVLRVARRDQERYVALPLPA